MKRHLIIAAVVGLFTTVSLPVSASCSLTDHYCNDEYEDQYDRQQEHIDAHNQMMRDAAEQHDEYLRDQEDDRRHNQIISLLEALK